MSRVRIGTCSGPADAALVRAMFSAHGICVVIGAENHSSMLAGLGGSFLSLDIWVDDEDSEEAAALLRDIREGDHTGVHELDEDDGSLDDDLDDDALEASGDDGDYACTGDFALTATAAAVRVGAAAPAEAHDSAFHRRIDRRRRTGIVLLLSSFITFGTAHMFTRAWRRGIALAGLELAGILGVIGAYRPPGVSHVTIGALGIGSAIATDMIGGLWRVWRAPRTILPTARLRRR